MTPEAMRRLADLQLEKAIREYARANAKPREMASSEARADTRGLSRAGSPNPAAAAASASLRGIRSGFSSGGTTAEAGIMAGSKRRRLDGLTAGTPPGADPEGPLEAIAPLQSAAHRVPQLTRTAIRFLYQIGRGRTTNSAAPEEAHRYNGAPDSHQSAFLALRRSAVQAGGEYFFTRQAAYRDAGESAFIRAIVKLRSRLGSSTSSLSISFGWTLYKQEFLRRRALQKVILPLLDHKVIDRLRLRSDT